MNPSAPIRDEDKQLLLALQAAFPLEREPFKVLGEYFGFTESEILARLQSWQAQGVLRRIGGILDPGKLGYSTLLAAMKLEPDGLESAARIVSALPQVTHNYLRGGYFNLWFTLVCRNSAQAGKILKTLRRKIRPRHLIALPVRKFYKLSAVFGFDREFSAPRQDFIACPLAFPREEELLTLASGSLELVPRPFGLWARKLEIGEDELLSGLKSLLKEGKLRRFGGVLRHREAGYRYNAMLVMALPESRADRAGEYLASLKAVSHCYLRRRNPLWPYNLYAMFHAESELGLDRLIEEAVEACRPRDYQALKTLKEYKKISWVKEGD